MSAVNVLVVFYSRYGDAERLALAAGVGAVQARASIRLRRLADLADPQTIEATPAWKASLARMQRDYVVPRPADPEWADVIVLVTPVETSAEVEAYCASLRASGVGVGKIAAPLAPGGSEAALRPVYAAAACAGLTVVPAAGEDGDPVASARAVGQRVTQMARALKP
jgi:NAD(P)H dehydrogenase (quinone)